MWTSLDGLSADQIDHVKTDNSHTLEITDVKSCTAADHDSNHFVLKVIMTQHYRYLKGKSTKKH
jgi:hypothetical protein